MMMTEAKASALGLTPKASIVDGVPGRYRSGADAHRPIDATRHAAEAHGALDRRHRRVRDQRGVRLGRCSPGRRRSCRSRQDQPERRRRSRSATRSAPRVHSCSPRPSANSSAPAGATASCRCAAAVASAPAPSSNASEQPHHPHPVCVAVPLGAPNRTVHANWWGEGVRGGGIEQPGAPCRAVCCVLARRRRLRRGLTAHPTTARRDHPRGRRRHDRRADRRT